MLLGSPNDITTYANVSEEDRYRHLFLMGGTGSGKTSYMLWLISQEIHNGMIVLDPHGDLAERVASLAGDRVIYVDKDHPMSFNPLYKRNLTKSAIARELFMTVNSAVDAVTQNVEFTVLHRKIIRNALEVFDDSEMSMEYLGDFMDDINLREKKRYHKFWKSFEKKKEMVDACNRISARLSMYYEDEDLAPFVKGRNEFDPGEIAKQKKVLVINLEGLDEESLAFVGNLITHQIKTYYRSNPVGHPLYVYIDEFHLFINKKYSAFLTEGRKHLLSFNFSCHNFAQIDKKLASAIMGSCFVKVLLGANAYDAEILSKQFNLDEKIIMSIGKREAYINVGKETCYVRTYKAPEVEPFVYTPISPKGINWLKDGWINV